MLSRVYFKCCPWCKWTNHSWENKQDLWKIIHWSTKKLSEFTSFICSRKEVGLLLLSNPSYFTCPNCCWFTCISEFFPQILIYYNVSTLLGWELKNWSLWRSLCSEAELTLCISRSWKGLPPFLSHKWVFLKYSVKVGKKQQLLFYGTFDASVICKSAPDSCRKADNFGLFLCLQQRQLTDHVFRNKARFAYWRHKSQYLLSHICHQL